MKFTALITCRKSRVPAAVLGLIIPVLAGSNAFIACAAERPSPLRGQTAGDQLSNTLVLMLADPDEFPEFVARQENRYYLGPGTAFARCGEAVKALNHIVSTGTSTSVSQGYDEIEGKLAAMGGPVGGPKYDPLAGVQVQNMFAPLAITPDIVQLVYRGGPQRFRESGIYRLITQMNEDMLRMMCMFGEPGCRENGMQIMAAAYQQQRDLLASYARPWCATIPPQPDPPQTDCGRAVRISAVDEDGKMVVLADGSRWRIPDEDDTLIVADWEAGEAVRVCGTALLHVDSLVRVGAKRNR